MAKWSEMPLAAKLGIILGAAIAVSAALYFVAYKNLWDENKANATLVQNQESQNETLARKYEPRRAELNRHIEQLKQQLEVQKRIVPDEKEAAEFIHLMQAKAQESNIEIRRYTAGTASTREFYTEVPFEVELDGPYYGVLTFFEKVAKLDRIINISGLKMSAVGGRTSVAKRRYVYAPGETVVAICTATTFFSHDAAAPPPTTTGKPGAPAPAPSLKPRL